MPFSVRKNGITYTILNYKKDYHPIYQPEEFGAFDILNDFSYEDSRLNYEGSS